MRSYSIRDLCREAADPTAPAERLAKIADEADRIGRSHRVRLYAALLGNPALPSVAITSLVEAAPQRLNRPAKHRVRPGPRLEFWQMERALARGEITLMEKWKACQWKDSNALPAPVVRALAGNPALALSRIADPLLASLGDEARGRVAISEVWPEVSAAWRSEYDDPPW